MSAIDPTCVLTASHRRAYGPEHLIDAMDRIRLPFNVNAPAQAAAVAALGDEVFQQASLGLVNEWRPWLTEQLGALGLEVVPSMTNFVLVGFPERAGTTAQEAEALLAQNGLLVRPVGAYGLKNHLRITVGRQEHNRALVQVLKSLLAPGDALPAAESGVNIQPLKMPS